MDKLDVKIYESLRDDLWQPVEDKLSQAGFVPKIVYVQTSVAKCNARIKQRNRLGEQDIPTEYLQHLEHLHEDWLASIPHVVVNNELDGPLTLE